MLDALQALSAQIGKDPLQVQAAGGNTSIKLNGVLWIKASGQWLAQAGQQPLFVPVKLDPLLKALENNDPRTEKCIDFVDTQRNENALRPSIETTVHAVLPQSVVVHVHCVDTIAIAIRQDAESTLRERLSAFSWLWVPYQRPGLPLSRYIREHFTPGTNVLILGNHGLVVAAESVDEAAELLLKVRKALHSDVNPAEWSEQAQADLQHLTGLCKQTDYLPSPCQHTHRLSFDSRACDLAAGGSLYPDHVIFLGDGTLVLDGTDNLSAALNKQTTDECSQPASIVIREQGVLMHKDSNPSQHAMARCLSDVCLRVSDNARANYLSSGQVYELLNWEAETYRQQLA